MFFPNKGQMTREW